MVTLKIGDMTSNDTPSHILAASRKCGDRGGEWLGWVELLLLVLAAVGADGDGETRVKDFVPMTVCESSWEQPQAALSSSVSAIDKM